MFTAMMATQSITRVRTTGPIASNAVAATATKVVTTRAGTRAPRTSLRAPTQGAANITTAAAATWTRERALSLRPLATSQSEK